MTKENLWDKVGDAKMSHKNRGKKMIASFIRSLFCLHKWKRLAEKTVVETFCGREAGRYSLFTEKCEKCGKIRQINLRGK